MSTIPLSLTQSCWIKLQVLVVRVVMRVLHAAFYELALSDSRVKAEFASIPEGSVLEIACYGASPRLVMQVQKGVPVYLESCPPRPLCSISLKSLGLAFRMFTGQLSLFVANAQHGFTFAGEVSTTMKIVRVICITESYLFPHLIARRVLLEVSSKEKSSIVLYLKILCGFIRNKYSRPLP